MLEDGEKLLMAAPTMLIPPHDPSGTIEIPGLAAAGGLGRWASSPAFRVSPTATRCPEICSCYRFSL
jgi:hypothetical protein